MEIEINGYQKWKFLKLQNPKQDIWYTGNFKEKEIHG